MRLPLSTATLTALGRGLTSDTSRRRRSGSTSVSSTVSRTAVLPGQSPLWRPPSRLTGLLERYDRMTPVLA
ncbi:MAG TPA: hypothetical protein VFL59_14835 [Candidatus Nanopelagicales bacterium]|nr:hypothetical protein [Candidatus Nanopelagicales bacterium]